MVISRNVGTFFIGLFITSFKGDRVKVLWGEQLKDNVIYIES